MFEDVRRSIDPWEGKKNEAKEWLFNGYSTLILILILKRICLLNYFMFFSFYLFLSLKVTIFK